MRVRTDCLMPRANNARGKVFGALPRIPARGTPPGAPARFPFGNGCSRTVLAVKGSLRRAQTARP